jgi:hypothetical protein
LWRRIDRALRIHEVQCQAVRIDRPVEPESHRRRAHAASAPHAGPTWINRVVDMVKRWLSRLASWPSTRLEPRFGSSLLCTE